MIMNTAITNKQRREISHLEYVFISRQVRGNCLLIHGELYQRALKQDELKQRPSALLSHNRRPKHSLWLNKRYIWNSKTKIVNRSTQQRYRKFYRQNKSLSTAVQLSRPCWTDSITCVRKLDNIVWSNASWDIWNSPLSLYPRFMLSIQHLLLRIISEKSASGIFIRNALSIMSAIFDWCLPQGAEMADDAHRSKISKLCRLCGKIASSNTSRPRNGYDSSCYTTPHFSNAKFIYTWNMHWTRKPVSLAILDQKLSF